MLIEGFQLLVEFRMALLEHAGLLEEGFRRHGEELGGIGGAIGIQRGVATEGAITPEPLDTPPPRSA